MQPITQYGAFTQQIANQINTALFQAFGATTGNVFYVNAVSGNDNYDGSTPANAFASLLAAYNKTVSGNNDVIVLIGNGAASGTQRITSNFAWANNATHLVGVCAPSQLSQRARMAPTTTQAAFANFFSVSGNGCLFQNVSWFHGFATGTTAQICLTVTGTRNAFINCDIEGMGDTASAVDAGSRSILLNGGGENIFSHCNIGLDTIVRTNANSSVEVKGGTVRNIFEHCTFPIWSSDGLQYILYGAAAACMDRWTLFKGCNLISGVGTAIAAAFNLAASAGGFICFDSGSGLFHFTAIGDATTKAQTYVSGGTATNGVKGIVAT